MKVAAYRIVLKGDPSAGGWIDGEPSADLLDYAEMEGSKITIQYAYEDPAESTEALRRIAAFAGARITPITSVPEIERRVTEAISELAAGLLDLPTQELRSPFETSKPIYHYEARLHHQEDDGEVA